MSEFQRYAIYHLPDTPDLASFGARWLGWDVAQGAAAAQFDLPGLEALTQRPRKYGFHGTLKPPFRLAEGATLEGLQTACESFARSHAPVTLDGLRLAAMGRFLALVPDGDAADLNDLAFACVRQFDRFRAALTGPEIDRRRQARLSPAQDALLEKWGYPYVGPEFRFHLTLTGPIARDAIDAAMGHVQDHLPPLPRPCQIGSISLVGERGDGMFELIQPYPLTG